MLELIVTDDIMPITSTTHSTYTIATTATMATTPAPISNIKFDFKTVATTSKQKNRLAAADNSTALTSTYHQKQRKIATIKSNEQKNAYNLSADARELNECEKQVRQTLKEALNLIITTQVSYSGIDYTTQPPFARQQMESIIQMCFDYQRKVIDMCQRTLTYNKFHSTFDTKKNLQFAGINTSEHSSINSFLDSTLWQSIMTSSAILPYLTEMASARYDYSLSIMEGLTDKQSTTLLYSTWIKENNQLLQFYFPIIQAIKQLNCMDKNTTALSNFKRLGLTNMMMLNDWFAISIKNGWHTDIFNWMATQADSIPHWLADTDDIEDQNNKAFISQYSVSQIYRALGYTAFYDFQKAAQCISIINKNCRNNGTHYYNINDVNMLYVQDAQLPMSISHNNTLSFNQKKQTLLALTPIKEALSSLLETIKTQQISDYTTIEDLNNHFSKNLSNAIKQLELVEQERIAAGQALIEDEIQKKQIELNKKFRQNIKVEKQKAKTHHQIDEVHLPEPDNENQALLSIHKVPNQSQSFALSDDRILHPNTCYAVQAYLNNPALSSDIPQLLKSVIEGEDLWESGMAQHCLIDLLSDSIHQSISQLDKLNQVSLPYQTALQQDQLTEDFQQDTFFLNTLKQYTLQSKSLEKQLIQLSHALLQLQQLTHKHPILPEEVLFHTAEIKTDIPMIIERLFNISNTQKALIYCYKKRGALLLRAGKITKQPNLTPSPWKATVQQLMTSYYAITHIQQQLHQVAHTHTIDHPINHQKIQTDLTNSTELSTIINTLQDIHLSFSSDSISIEHPERDSLLLALSTQMNATHQNQAVANNQAPKLSRQEMRAQQKKAAKAQKKSKKVVSFAPTVAQPISKNTIKPITLQQQLDTFMTQKLVQSPLKIDCALYQQRYQQGTFLTNIFNEYEYLSQEILDELTIISTALDCSLQVQFSSNYHYLFQPNQPARQLTSAEKASGALSLFWGEDRWYISKQNYYQQTGAIDFSDEAFPAL